jgi:hypothetical protein
LAKSQGKSKSKPPADEKPAAKSASKSSGKSGGKAAAGFKGYLEQTKLPVYSLTFVLPLVLFYEVAIVVVNQPLIATRGYGIRVTADDLLRDMMGTLLSAMGLGGFFMSGILVVAVLLAWQIISRKPWDVKLGTLLGMLVESLLIGFVLYLAARYVLDPLTKMTIENDSAPQWLYSSLFRDIVLGVGAGVYEEFVFRLVLVWTFALIVAGFTNVTWDRSIVVAVFLSALAFAASHHMGLMGDKVTWETMAFRTSFGLLFGALYYFRGFGVAVGAHALYDVFCSVHNYLAMHHGGA